IGAFAARMRRHKVSAMMADGHYRESVAEHLGEIGLIDTPVTFHEACVRARTLMRDGRVALPDPELLQPEHKLAVERLIRQLKEVMGRPTSGGLMTIILPLWPDGSHGDLAVAFIWALYQMGGEREDAPPPKRDTDEWGQAELERFQAEIRGDGERRSHSRFARR